MELGHVALVPLDLYLPTQIAAASQSSEMASNKGRANNDSLHHSLTPPGFILTFFLLTLSALLSLAQCRGVKNIFKWQHTRSHYVH